VQEVDWDKCMVGSASPVAWLVPWNIKTLVWKDGPPIRNEPLTLGFVLKRLAELSQEKYLKAARETSVTAMGFFGLEKDTDEGSESAAEESVETNTTTENAEKTEDAAKVS
jgi:hypothetical protein